MSDYTVKVAITADTSAYTAGVRKAATGTDTLEKSASKTSKTMDRFGTTMTVAGTAGLVALGALAKASVDAASDLAESQSKVGVVFGDSADEIKTWAKDSARAFGQSEQQALEAAGTFGNLFTAMGIGGDKAQDMSTSMVELAADLASFNNIGVDEALEKIRAGLVGEAEPLRTLGVNLSAATIEAEAMALGLGAAGRELTAAEKAQGSYSLILKQTTTAQGDFARTSDGLANQQRIMAAEFENAKASLGQSLMPAMTQAAGAAADLFGWFAKLPAGLQSTTLALAAMGAAALIVAPRLVGLAASMKAVDMSAKSAAMSVGKGGLYGAIALLATLAIGDFVKDISDASSALDRLGSGGTLADLRSELDDTRASVEEYKNIDMGEIAGSAGLIGIRMLADELTGHFDSMDSEVADAESRIRGFFSITNQLATETGASAESVRQLADSLGLAGDSSEWAKEQLRGAIAEQAAGKTSAGELATATETLSDATASAADQSDAYADSLKSLNATILGITDAEIAFEASLDGLTESVKENGRSLNIGSEAGRANASALADLARNAQDAAQAEYDLAVSQGDAANATSRANGVYQKHAAQIDAVVAATGLSRAAVEKLIGKYDQIPANVGTKVTADTSQAQTAVNKFITRNDGRVFRMVGNVAIPSSPGVVRAKATGGYISGPGTATSDSIPALLSNGEYVIRASSVDKYGAGMMSAINAGKFASGGLVGGRAVSARATGATYAVTVNVGGSVTTERDLVRSVRDGLSTMSDRGDRV